MIQHQSGENYLEYEFFVPYFSLTINTSSTASAGLWAKAQFRSGVSAHISAAKETREVTANTSSVIIVILFFAAVTVLTASAENYERLQRSKEVDKFPLQH